MRAPETRPAFVPVVRVFSEPVIVTRTEGLSCECEEMTAPLISLSFAYQSPGRDPAAEREARRILERMGAVELECLDDIALPPGVEADYVVRPDGNSHSFCAFVAQAIPQLRALGWRVEVTQDFPFQVVESEVSFFADVEPHEELPDWFSLELGVELDGKRIDLLPLIVDLLDEAGEDDGLKSLLRRFTSSYALRVSDTHHVTISADRLRSLLHVVVELYQGVGRPTNKIEFPAVRAPALARLDKAFDKKLTWNDPTGIAQRARNVLEPPPIADPPTLKASLRDYQKRGVAFLQHLRDSGGILADDMGLGKTLQTIAHLCLEKESGRLTHPALVVCPTSLTGNWQRELAKFAPHLTVVAMHGPARKTRWKDVPTADVVITSYPVLLRDEERFVDETFHIVILDEAQAIKNTRSLAHRALKRINAAHRLCLTGTPVENHLGELWALFDFLSPGLLGDEVTFRRWYRQPIEQRGDEERMAALRAQVSPYVLRRVKRDVAKELPPKTELLKPVELSGKQRELYESIRVAAHADVRKVIRSKGLAASTITILDALMKLRQVCCDPRLVAMDAARSVTESAKFRALMEMLETQLAQGHRALIFSQFTSMLALIADGLRERGTGYLTLTGASRDRQRIVDSFERGDADVFLISLKAGGTGLNLVSADTVIHYDPWWNPAAQAQATDRAYRIGQSRPVFVYNLFAAGSVEERVIQLQKRKRWLSSALLGDESQGTAFTESDVETLFAPLDD